MTEEQPRAYFIARVGEGYAELLEFAGSTYEDAITFLKKKYAKLGKFNENSREVLIVDDYITVLSVPFDFHIVCEINIPFKFTVSSSIPQTKVTYVYLDKEFSSLETVFAQRLTKKIEERIIKEAEDYIKAWREENDPETV